MQDYSKEIATPPSLPSETAEEFLVPSNAKLVRQMRTAAGWLWAYAALSIANLVLLQIAVPFRMIVGLITTEYVVLVGRAVQSVAIPLSYAIAAVLIGVTALVAFFTQRFAVWAFWAGIALLAADAIVNYLVTTLTGVWPFVLHGVAIWFLVLGLKAARLHRERKAAGKA